MNIAEFLEARIAEDEVTAALRGWHAEDCGWLPNESGYSYPCNCGVPERMAAECAAKRGLCNLHSLGNYRGQEVCNDCGDWWDGSPVGYPCETVKVLAAAYKYHDDYQEQWAPNAV